MHLQSRSELLARRRSFQRIRAISGFVTPWGCRAMMLCCCGFEFSVPATRKKIQCLNCGIIRDMAHILECCKFESNIREAGIFEIPPEVTL